MILMMTHFPINYSTPYFVVTDLGSDIKQSLFQIPTKIEESQPISKLNGRIECQKDFTNYEIPVPEKWIRSGTLVEFEVIGKICSQYNTSDTCQRELTPTMTCTWCEKVNACIQSNDHNTHGLKINDCRVQNISDVNDVSISKTMKHNETTSGITEVQNMTTETTEENKQHKLHWYLYVVISLVALLFLTFIGFIIWKLLLRFQHSTTAAIHTRSLTNIAQAKVIVYWLTLM
ncbi:unnamed protein product [Schistosoma rodhaini]|uniref:Uncharacterized protein n=1 Tax=Schistosoma rodhaini TaxID=6188 RepID=A0AA85G650_9TREM|nr:unnamed protein product [Schistosoma rodhaini]